MVVLSVIPSERANGTVLVRCKVEEVDVLATIVVEVVVLARSRVDGRGSRDLGDGSRSRSFGEVLDDSDVFGATLVAHSPQEVGHSGSDLRVLPT